MSSKGISKFRKIGYSSSLLSSSLNCGAFAVAPTGVTTATAGTEGSLAVSVGSSYYGTILGASPGLPKSYISDTGTCRGYFC
jgi:hypothetical protein